MIKEAIVKIVSKEDLTYEEAYTVMNEIMSGETTPTQNAAFLAALSTKSAKAETKKIKPKRLPPGMSAKTLLSVMKRSPGPEVGSRP